MLELGPQAGPQEHFAACTADIAIYGGSAGGGKTYGALLEAVRWFDVPGYEAVIFRRTFPSIRRGGGLWAKSREIYPQLGGKPKQDTYEWNFPSGARVAFSHLQHLKDLEDHQGGQYAVVIFDELTEFEEEMFWFLFGRNRSTCGVRPYMRATCNPDPDSFVRRLVGWWIGPDGFAIPERSGVVRWFVRIGDEMSWYDTEAEAKAAFPEKRPISLTFIRSTLEDNKALLAVDPGYADKLDMLPSVLRQRFKLGNWDARPHAGDYFRTGMFEVIEAAPPVIRTVRAWDRAGTKPSAKNPDPDWTAGILASKAQDGSLIIHHCELMREEPTAVDAAQASLASQDGKDVQVCVWQDPGAAGKAEVAHIKRRLHGYDVRSEVASRDKVAYATPVASMAGAGAIKLVRGAWNEQFLRQLEAFPDGAHDDCVDALSLASLCLEDTTPEIYLV